MALRCARARCCVQFKRLLQLSASRSRLATIHRLAPTVNYIFAVVKGGRHTAGWQPAGAFTAHRRLIELIARSIHAHTRQRAPNRTHAYLRLPVVDVITRGAPPGRPSMCECAAIIWNSAVTPPTYRHEYSERVRPPRAVITIINHLVIIIRDASAGAAQH